jgi:hypothetical protein
VSMRPGKQLLAALLLAFYAAGVEARELYGPEAGVVPFGMGRAYSAVADDWLALYYNPAGLALVNGVDLQLFDLRIGSNRDVIESYDNVKKLSDSSKSVAAVLNEFAGRHVMAEISNHSQITVPGFALGLGYQVHASVDMQNKAYPQTLMRYSKDLSFNTGAALGFGPRKDFRIGTRIGHIRRQGGAREIEIDEIAGNKSSLVDLFQNSGSGWSGTVGVQYRLPSTGRTEVITSFVWHDIGKTSFGGQMAKDRPTRIEDNMVAGLALRFPIGGAMNRRYVRRHGHVRTSNHLTFAFDYSHLNYGLGREHFPKHTHLGMNLDLPLLSFQLGLNQTSLTFGTAFDIGLVRVALATYGEELGSYAGQRRDRRYLLSIGSSLGFKGF